MGDNDNDHDDDSIFEDLCFISCLIWMKLTQDHKGVLLLNDDNVGEFSC